MTLHLDFEGFCYPSWWKGAYADAASRQSLDDMVKTRANAIELNVEYFVNTYQSNAIYADPVGTESMTNLGKAIDDAHQRGLTVMVKPFVDSKDGIWRGQFHPTDLPAFFASYKAMIVAEAQVAEAHGAELFAIGCETDQLAGSDNLGYWTDIIAAVRQVYHGELTYAADWTNPAAVSFWSQLDYAGIDNYVPLSHDPNPTITELVAAWTQVSSDPEIHQYFGNKSPIRFFEDFAASVDKPLLFTELGYGSNTLAASDPANFWDPSSPNAALQAKLYQAFFEAWNQQTTSALKGVFLWDWNTFPDGPNSGNGDWPTGYTPQNKPAEAVITHWFGTGPNQINGTAGANALRGTFHVDRMNGFAGDDRIAGLDGSDLLIGGLGRDVLVGGPGRDHFRFNTPPSAQNVDRIVDYSVANDAPIELARAVFTHLAKGTLTASAFVTGAAVNPHQLISYRPATGALIYDDNGSIAGHAAQIATLAPGLHLTHFDFVVF